MNKYLIILLAILLIILTIILVLYFKKEHFQDNTNPVSNFLVDRRENRSDYSAVAAFANINKFKLIDDPNNYNPQQILTQQVRLHKIKMYNLKNYGGKMSQIIIRRQYDGVVRPFTLGFYLEASVNENFEDFLTCYGNTDTTIPKLKISLDYRNTRGKLTFIIPNSDTNQLVFNINFKKHYERDLNDGRPNSNKPLDYFIISIENNPETRLPDINITINNSKHKIPIKNSSDNIEEQLKSIQKFNIQNFSGYIGKILLYNRILTEEELCDKYDCNIVCYTPNGQTSKLNECIDDCNKSCNNIVKCQKICVDCEVKNTNWSIMEKKERCPWYGEIFRLEKSPPSAAKIRGFPGNKSLLIEWRKPYDGQSPITNYIIIYYESYNKEKGIYISVSEKIDKDICEHQLVNLKNKTSYDIIVRAVNNKGLGKPSNIVTLSPNGTMSSNYENNLLSSMDYDINNTLINDKLDYNCELNDFDSQQNILDMLDDDKIDIQQFLQNKFN